MNSTACRYYTERTLGWMMNNKMIVFLSLLSFCLFVSTLTIAGQRNRLVTQVNDLEVALENAKTTVSPTDAPEGQNTETPEPEIPAPEVLETEAPIPEAPATEAPAPEAPVTEAPATEAPETEAPSNPPPEEDPSVPEGRAFDVNDNDSVVSGYQNSRLLRRLGFVA